jgi:hypothetical protein
VTDRREPRARVRSEQRRRTAREDRSPAPPDDRPSAEELVDRLPEPDWSEAGVVGRRKKGRYSTGALFRPRPERIRRSLGGGFATTSADWSWPALEESADDGDVGEVSGDRPPDEERKPAARDQEDTRTGRAEPQTGPGEDAAGREAAGDASEERDEVADADESDDGDRV